MDETMEKREIGGSIEKPLLRCMASIRPMPLYDLCQLGSIICYKFPSVMNSRRL